MIPLSVPFIVLLALLGGACGSGQRSQTASPAAEESRASAGGAGRDACALITADEATKILGSPAKVVSRSLAAERSACDYVTQAYESFTLEVRWKGADEALDTARSAATAAAALAGAKQDQVVNEVMGLQRVENLGDEAYFSRRTMSYVRKGDVLLVFQNAGLNDPAREHWEALARAALARL